MSEPIRSSISLDDYVCLISAMERNLDIRAVKFSREDVYTCTPIEPLDITFPQEAAYSCFSYSSQNGAFIEVLDEGPIWSFGNPNAKAIGTRKTISPNALLAVHWMCFLTLRPVLYIGSSNLWDTALYFRGMVGPFIGSHGDGGVTSIPSTTESLLVPDNTGWINEELVSELEKEAKEPGVNVYLGALRESLLFYHPEIAVSYAAWMGSTNLGPKTLGV